MHARGIRPQRRPRRTQSTRRPWRRRIRHDVWAFVPGGGALEKRLRGLIRIGAEDAVRAALAPDAPKPFSRKSTGLQRCLPSPGETVLRNHAEWTSQDGDFDSAQDSTHLEPPANYIRSLTPDEGHVDRLTPERETDDCKPVEKDHEGEDADTFRCASQELPLVGSQMSEGLEILLRASQETIDNDQLPMSERNDRAARRLWRSLEDVYVSADALPDESQSIPALNLLPR